MVQGLTFNELLAALKENLSRTPLQSLAGITHIRQEVADVDITVTYTASSYGPQYYVYPAWNTEDLQNWWTLDALETVSGSGGVRDSIGSFDGTETGGITTTTEDDITIGRQRRYTVISGASIDVGDVTFLDGATAFSIGCKFRPLGVDGVKTIISRWPTANGDKQFKVYYTSEGKLRITIATNGGGGSETKESDDAVLVTNTWYSLVMAVDLTAESYMLALDGVAIDTNHSAWYSTSLQTVADSILIGADESDAGNGFVGHMYDVCLWDDNLSEAEALAFHNDAITDRIGANFFRAPGSLSVPVPAGTQPLDAGMGVVVSSPIPSMPQLTNFL